MRLGLVAIALMALHAGLFVLGATLRAGIFASQYLTPSFSSGYYRAVITVGLAALVLVVIGAISAAARWRMRRIWRVGHWAVFVAFGLGFIHSLLIGSESRIAPMLAFYASSGAATVAVLARRLAVGLNGPGARQPAPNRYRTG